MTDDNSADGSTYRLSRRGVLGGLATVGTVAAGAGLTTTALFSDTEQIDGEVTAGTLDLSVDWEEHSVTPGAAPGAADVRTDPPSSTDDYVAFPAGADDPMLWVRKGDSVAGGDSSLDLFMDETTLESYPDADDDGLQDDLSDYDPCVDFAQAGTDSLDPRTSTPNDASRTLSSDTVERDANGDIVGVEPMISVENAVPGQFGEVTLSMHLCGSPGYVWLQSDLVEAAENGYTEPEADAAAESGDADGDGDDDRVELLDTIQTLVWYDEDGDNVYEPGTNGGSGSSDPAEVVLVLDHSGSMHGSKIREAKAGAKQLVGAVGEDDKVGLVPFASWASVAVDPTTDEDSVADAIDRMHAGGGTDLSSAIETASDALSDDGDNQYLVVLSDGHPNDGHASRQAAKEVKDDGVDVYTIAYGGGADLGLLEDVASSPAEKFAYVSDVEEVTQVFGQIAKSVTGEKALFKGSLRDLLDLTQPDPDDGAFGIPLDGDRSTEFEEVTGTDADDDGLVDANYGLGDASADAREPFVDATINQIGFSWWIPESAGNEIQSDSVKFDLGFYAEQAANNAGGGSA